MIKTYWKCLGTLQECEIVSCRGDNCLIKYWSPVLLDYEELWVPRESLVFPKFSDYGAM